LPSLLPTISSNKYNKILSNIPVITGVIIGIVSAVSVIVGIYLYYRYKKRRENSMNDRYPGQQPAMINNDNRGQEMVNQLGEINNDTNTVDMDMKVIIITL
jgi:hypothetical protein